MSGEATEPAARIGARVEARALTRCYGDNVALDALDLEIEPGETFALLGANGAGKTTFNRLLTGFLLPTSGRITIDGVSPSSRPDWTQPRTGFVAERTQLYPELGVRRFLAFVAGLRGLAGDACETAVARALERFGLHDVARRPIGHLSKGYQQRVSLAQGFIHEPALLVADEPSSGLDPVQQDEMQTLLASLRGRTTVVLCTHDLAEARRLAQRVAVLSHGRLVACGPTAEVLGGDDPLALFRTRDAAPVAEGAAR